MKFRSTCILIAPAMLMATQAHADILTFVVPYTTASIAVPMFDSALGTLNGATLTLDGHLEAPFIDTTPSPASGTYTYAAFYSFYYFDRYLDVGVSGSGAANFGTSPVIFLSADGLGSGAIAADRLAFTIGTGTFSGHIVTDPPYTGSATGGTITPDTITDPLISGTLTIAYSYTAVPEPASWAMMIAGVGLIGLTARRSRRLAFA